jgi:hypothetical protein
MFDINQKFEQQQDEIDELRAKLKEKENWELTEAKYTLRRSENNTFFYQLKEQQTPLDHYTQFCAICFGNKKLVVLQNGYCHECKLGI